MRLFSVFWGEVMGPNNCDLLVSVLCLHVSWAEVSTTFFRNRLQYFLVCFCCLSCSLAFRYHLFRRAALRPLQFA